MSISSTGGSYIVSTINDNYYNIRTSVDGSTIKVKKIKAVPEKKEVHVFDIKDLNLKEE